MFAGRMNSDGSNGVWNTLTMMNGGNKNDEVGKWVRREKEKKVAVEEDGKLGDRWDVFLAAALHERGKMKYFERNLSDLITHPLTHHFLLFENI